MLMTRVANLRASRGDLSGAERARSIAKKLERGLGLGFWGVMWSMGWDYMKNYAWRDMAPMEMFGAVKDLNELLRSLSEVTQLDSDLEKVAWGKRNYKKILKVSNSLLGRLLRVFRQSGPLREVVETVQREVVDGGLLWDCLELGSGDLKGLIQIVKDVAEQFSSSYADQRDL